LPLFQTHLTRNNVQSSNSSCCAVLVLCKTFVRAGVVGQSLANFKPGCHLILQRTTAYLKIRFRWRRSKRKSLFKSDSQTNW